MLAAVSRCTASYAPLTVVCCRYKWKHSRAVVADALVKQYSQLAATGWPISEQAIGADVHRLFGGAYEDFMAKQ